MVAVHLNKQIDDIFSGYSKLRTPEERIEHKVEGNMICEGFEELVRQYEDILAIYDWLEVEVAVKEINAILEPEQINSFLQAMKRYESYKNHASRTGIFITQLIQNSHYDGNNKFTLSTKASSKGIDCLAYKLQGREDRSLEIIVEGDVGDCCCQDGKNIGRLYINGGTGVWCSTWVRNIQEFHISGHAGEFCGCNAENSTFKTPNKETLRLLKYNVPKDKDNRIFFIHPNSQEEEIKW
ncbi:MAG: hypothetical protein ABIB71_06925 [Candidatus Woesearchaeota archaeon]